MRIDGVPAYKRQACDLKRSVNQKGGFEDALQLREIVVRAKRNGKDDHIVPIDVLNCRFADSAQHEWIIPME